MPLKFEKKGKYNEANVNKILQLIRAGNTYKTAHLSAGVASSTFYEWLNDKPEFKEAVEQAEQDAIIELLKCIKSAGDRDWRANAWILERRSQEYNKQEKVDVTSKDEKIEFTINIKRPTSDINESE